MTDAGLLTCPSCGASVHEGARRCAHCDAAVATVRCATCFHLSPTDAQHCSACGRELGLEPVPRDGSLACPTCHAPMAALDCGPGLLLDCGRCGGQLVDWPALRDLLERHDRGEHGEVEAPRSVRALQPEVVRYLPCPGCGASMNRKNFGAGCGVVVDVCRKHGTWFDAGELPRVLAFAESGGLARQRRRDLEEQHRAAHERAAQAMAPGHASPEPHGLGSGGSLVAELLAGLFG